MIERDLTRREERHFLREFRHGMGYRYQPCGFWCWRCLWATLTDGHDRARRAHIARVKELMVDLPRNVIKHHLSDDVAAAARERGIQKHIDRVGEVRCPRPHQNLFAPDSRCYCGAQA